MRGQRSAARFRGKENVMSNISDLSRDLGNVVETLGASVVRVEARRRTPATGVVWADGVIVTTSHGVEREEGIEIAGPDGTTGKAELAGRDPATDIAVLKGTVAGVKPTTWSDLDGVKVGHLALAVARPGRTVRASLGIVSTLGADWRTDAGGKIDRYLQTDLELFPGFSGSLLADVGGRVLGLNTSGLLRRYSMAIPTSTAKRVVESLLTRGRVQRGHLGIVSYPVRLPSSLESSVGQRTGLLVAQVQADSPAEKAGITLGDVLIAFNGRPVTHVGELFEQLDEDQIGKEVVVRVVRGGEPRDIKVTVGARNWS
jgi:S1-C subfamily serine protease